MININTETHSLTSPPSPKKTCPHVCMDTEENYQKEKRAENKNKEPKSGKVNGEGASHI